MRFLFSGREKTYFVVAAVVAAMVWVCSVSASFAAPFSPGGRIFTLAGDGTEGFSGDGGPARAAQLNKPWDSLALPDGSVLIADDENNRVRKVDAGGAITTFAGNGIKGHAGDGGPAIAAELDGAEALAAMADGSILIVENERVRRVSLDGVITTFAGSGTFGSFTDGADADKAPLGYTDDVDVMSDGSVLIASWSYCAIRIVKPGGKIYNFAGNPPRTGACDYSGDGGPAKAADIGRPNSLAVAPDDSVYVVDRYSQRIRRIDPTGNIDLYAGQPTWGFSGDGGPARSAQFSYPLHVAVAPDGSVFVADTGNRRVRKIDAKTNTVTTYAGGHPSYRGSLEPEGGLAVDSFLDRPVSVDVNSSGHVLVTDLWDSKVRFVTPTVKVPGGGTP